MFWIKNQLGFLAHPLICYEIRDFSIIFTAFFFAVFHFQSPYQSIATNFASLPGSTKALGEAARQFGAETFNRFNP